MEIYHDQKDRIEALLMGRTVRVVDDHTLGASEPWT